MERSQDQSWPLEVPTPPPHVISNMETVPGSKLPTFHYHPYSIRFRPFRDYRVHRPPFCSIMDLVNDKSQQSCLNFSTGKETINLKYRLSNDQPITLDADQHSIMPVPTKEDLDRLLEEKKDSNCQSLEFFVVKLDLAYLEIWEEDLILKSIKEKFEKVGERLAQAETGIEVKIAQLFVNVDWDPLLGLGSLRYRNGFSICSVLELLDVEPTIEPIIMENLLDTLVHSSESVTSVIIVSARLFEKKEETETTLTMIKDILTDDPSVLVGCVFQDEASSKWQATFLDLDQSRSNPTTPGAQIQVKYPKLVVSFITRLISSMKLENKAVQTFDVSPPQNIKGDGGIELLDLIVTLVTDSDKVEKGNLALSAVSLGLGCSLEDSYPQVGNNKFSISQTLHQS